MRTYLTLLFAVTGLLPIHAATITVNPGTDLIQAAINSAAAGDTISLAAGVHRVTITVTVNKRLIISGAGQGSTFIDKYNGTTADVAAIVVTANSCTLRNFTLRGRNVGGPGIIMFSDGNSLSNLAVSACGNDSSLRSGLLFDTSNSNTLSSVSATNNRMVGISHSQSSGNTLANCVGDNNGAEGLTIDTSSNNVHVSGGHFNGNNNRGSGVGGIGIDHSNGAWVQNATIDGTGGGKSGVTFQDNLGGCDGCIVKNNTISHSADFGIRQNNCQYSLTNTTTSPNTYNSNANGNTKFCPY
jgi:parallel beta-helix repeat protein